MNFSVLTGMADDGRDVEGAKPTKKSRSKLEIR
jgi:hypothetical protein